MPDNDGDNPRRSGSRPDDNPFIAFRRFADSQVSSLFNALFTLPDTLADFNHANRARAQCLFGHADHLKCDKLQEVESRILELRSEGTDSYEANQELTLLSRYANGLRNDINKESDERIIRAPQDHALDEDTRYQKALVEKVGSEKGQQWGFSWNWGFPRPFDEDSSSENNKRTPMRLNRREPFRPTGSDWDASDEEEKHWQRFGELAKRWVGDEMEIRAGQPKNWFWLGSWPPPVDASHQEHSNNRIRELEEIAESELVNMAHALMTLFPAGRHGYSPQTLELDETMNKRGLSWRDAYEDLIRAEQGVPLIPPNQLGQSNSMPWSDWLRRLNSTCISSSRPSQQHSTSNPYPKRVPWEDDQRPTTDEELSYEYSHDHEDQHDDPPTPKEGQGKWSNDFPATELDAYERLLGPTALPPESQQTEIPAQHAQSSSSILSTLTTTERSIAPDGSVTTKIVLKKRFADGREESSETVQTQKGGEDGGGGSGVAASSQDAFRAMQNAQFGSRVQGEGERQHKEEKGAKRNGWFWSS